MEEVKEDDLVVACEDCGGEGETYGENGDWLCIECDDCLKKLQYPLSENQEEEIIAILNKR